MTFAQTGTGASAEITQTGTDTSLSGLESLEAVTKEVKGFGDVWILASGAQLIVEGTLTIPPGESLEIQPPNDSEIVIQVATTGTLNVGAQESNSADYRQNRYIPSILQSTSTSGSALISRSERIIRIEGILNCYGSAITITGGFQALAGSAVTLEHSFVAASNYYWYGDFSLDSSTILSDSDSVGFFLVGNALLWQNVAIKATAYFGISSSTPAGSVYNIRDIPSLETGMGLITFGRTSTINKPTLNVTNATNGSDYSFISTSGRSWIANVFKDVNVSISDASANPVESAFVAITGNTDYSATTDSSGETPTISAQLVNWVLNSGSLTTTYYSKNSNSTDIFDVYTISYEHLFSGGLITSEAFKGSGDLDINWVLLDDPSITESDKSIVDGYTGFAVDTGTSTITLTTGFPSNPDALFDKAKAWKRDNFLDKFPAINQLLLNAVGASVSLGSLTLDISGYNGTFAAGTTFESILAPAASTINLAAGTYDLQAFTFASGSTLNLDSGTATVTVASDPGIITTGAGTINIVAPTVAVTISPLISGSRLKIYDTGTTTLVDGVNSSGTSFSFSTGTNSQGYDIYIVNPGQKSVFINNYIYPSSSATLPVEQTADINYSATAGAYDITLDGSGIGVSADLWLDTANVEIQLATGNNLSQPTGISLQNLYSFIIESRYANDELMPYHDPVVAISATAGEFELRRGWHLKDNTTRDLIRDGGLAQYSAANALEIEWLNITGLGNLATAATPYYWQSDVTNPTIVEAINSGLPNQLVQVFGDASNGNFDLRTFLKLSIRAQGENTVTYDLAAEQDLSSLNPQRYFIPLTTTANPNITIADTAIDANSDGAADIAPFDGMSVTYLDGTGFTAWANSTVYAANAVVSDGGRWYITTAGGTSSGTGVGDDTGVTWAAYSGERQIDGSYYAFNIIYDANNGTLEQMTAYLFWLVRQDVDIDAGSANRTGRVADRIATTRGSDLIMATGGVVDSFAIAAQLTHIPVDVGGTERPYPAPPVGFSAANVADGSRFFLAHEQTFTVAAADINTADNDITLGNDNNGDAAAFASASPYTTVHVNLTSGATMPTTSPQIVDGGRYYATVSSGDMQLFSAESDIPGNPISFSDQGTDSSGSVFTAAAETELYNASVSGGSGVFQTLSLSNGTSVLRKAIYWDNSGTTTATPLFIQRFTWSATAGVSDPQVVNVSSEVDTIHNRIISLTNLELDGEIKNASGVGVTSVTPTNDGSSLSSVYGLVLEGGGGRLQVNSNDSDGIAIWQDLYAWGVFVTSTESGIRLVNADTFTAVNLRTFDLKNLQFDNISSTPLAIVGGIARTIDGSSLLAQPQTGSGGIAFNALALGTGATVETGVSGLTSGEAATLAKLDDLTELDGVIYRFTANALEQAPSGGGGGDDAATIYTYFTSSSREDAFKATGFSSHSAADVRAEIDANSTQLAAILADTGTDIPVSISALNNLSQTDIRTAVGLSSANLDTQLGDIPTVSEFNARTLASADYFDPAADTVANVTTTGSVSGDVGGVTGVTFPASFNNLSSADVQTAATSSLNAYNPPTRAELTTDINSILTQGNASWATADVSGLSTFNHASDQVIVATNNDKSGYSLTQAFPSNFALLAIDGSGQVTTGAMGGTVTVGGYAAGQAPNDLIDISTIQSNVGLILGHTRPMAKQLGLVSGVTATHTPTAITVSDGDGSTTITDNGSDSYTVQGA